MVDIHCHILPDSYDGPKNMKESVNMCKLAYDTGIRGVICTPHYIFGFKQTANAKAVQYHTQELNRELKEINLDITIFPGMEVSISHDIIELYESGEILTLNKSRYMLVELPQNGIPVYTEKLFHELVIREIIPVIAHPERNLNIIKNPRIVEKYVEKGILLQINAGSLEGTLGHKVRNTARYFLNNKLIHFIASDAHTSEYTFKIMADLYKRLRSINIEYADKIFIKNPSYLINNEELI